jgi:hypothetical protein
MDDIQARKVNLDDLFEHKKNHDMLTIKSFNSILDKIHSRIKVAARQRLDNTSCWFVVPEILLGVPKYDVRACVAYLISELRENGFQVKYTHPNLLFITWEKWVPSYVREEYKKQTGVCIDGFGKEVKLIDEKKMVKAESKFTPITNYKPLGIYSNLFKG